MQVNQDYEDLFKTLNTYKIKYLVVGAYAVMYYSEPRFTKDIDVWIIPDLNDSRKVYEALRSFGAPLRSVSPDDFKDKSMVLQIGVAPIRIDIMLGIPGLSFEQAWKNRKRIRYGKTPIHILGKEDIIAAKKTSGRPQDIIDLERLEKNK